MADEQLSLVKVSLLGGFWGWEFIDPWSGDIVDWCDDPFDSRQEAIDDAKHKLRGEEYYMEIEPEVRPGG